MPSRLSRADYCRIVRVVLLLVEVAVVLLSPTWSTVRWLGLVVDADRACRPVGRWRPRHYAEGGQTVVTVARMSPAGDVFEEHVVARIADSDDDWSRKFLEAKQEAEERAFHLNADSD
jgi:hypothetical protein